MTESGLISLIDPIKIITLLGYFLGVCLLSVLLFRAILEIVNGFGTYHYLESNIDNSDEGEPFKRKVFLVFLYNMAGVFGSLFLLLGTEITTQAINTISSQLNYSISFDSAVGIIIVSVLFTAAIRISMLSGFTYGDLDKEEKEERKKKIISFSFSFWASIYFVLVLAFGIAISKGGIGQGLKGPNLNFQIGIVIFFIAIFLSALSAFSTEYAIANMVSTPDVHKSKKTDS